MSKKQTITQIREELFRRVESRMGNKDVHKCVVKIRNSRGRASMIRRGIRTDVPGLLCQGYVYFKTVSESEREIYIRASEEFAGLYDLTIHKVIVKRCECCEELYTVQQNLEFDKRLLELFPNANVSTCLPCYLDQMKDYDLVLRTKEEPSYPFVVGPYEDRSDIRTALERFVVKHKALPISATSPNTLMAMEAVASLNDACGIVTNLTLEELETGLTLKGDFRPTKGVKFDSVPQFGMRARKSGEGELLEVISFDIVSSKKVDYEFNAK